MLYELSLLATITLHHLLIGACLLLLLSGLIALLKPTAELQSWLWVSAFIFVALIPFVSLSLANNSPVAVKNVSLWTSPIEKDVAVKAMEAAESINAPTWATAEESLVAQQQRERTLQWNISGKWVDQLSNYLYVFLIVWLIGSGWRIFNVSRSLIRTRHIINTASPLENQNAFSAFNKFRILTSEISTSPIVVGLLHPVIVLPKSLLTKLNERQLGPIVLHESAHIERGDLWVGIIEELIAILFWWSPVIRILCRKIHITRELACDMRAAKKLASGKHYAQSLIDCAQLMLTQNQNVLAMGLFSKKKELIRRVNEVLKIKNVNLPSVFHIVLACAVFVAASFSLAENIAPQINMASIEAETKYKFDLSRDEDEKLLKIIRKGDMSALKSKLAEGFDINKPVPGEGTALIEAVRTGNVSMVKFLIDQGADVNLASAGDGNPLTNASAGNQIEIAKILYKNGADINAAAPGDGSPLIVAARKNHYLMAEALVGWGADVNVSVEWDGNPLIAAATNGNIKLAKLLVSQKADVNAVVPTDETALINASRHGHIDVVKYLVEEGADVNLGVYTLASGKKEYRSPLNMAKTEDIRAYLISKGAWEKK